MLNTKYLIRKYCRPYSPRHNPSRRSKTTGGDGVSIQEHLATVSVDELANGVCWRRGGEGVNEDFCHINARNCQIKPPQKFALTFLRIDLFFCHLRASDEVRNRAAFWWSRCGNLDIGLALSNTDFLQEIYLNLLKESTQSKLKIHFTLSM